MVTSPYLLGVSAYLLIYTITPSFLYLAQQRVVAEAGADQAARTALNESGLKSSNTPMLWFAGPLCVIGAGLGMWLGGAAKRKG